MSNAFIGSVVRRRSRAALATCVLVACALGGSVLGGCAAGSRVPVRVVPAGATFLTTLPADDPRLAREDLGVEGVPVELTRVDGLGDVQRVRTDQRGAATLRVDPSELASGRLVLSVSAGGFERLLRQPVPGVGPGRVLTVALRPTMPGFAGPRLEDPAPEPATAPARGTNR